MKFKCEDMFCMKKYDITLVGKIFKKVEHLDLFRCVNQESKMIFEQ